MRVVAIVSPNPEEAQKCAVGVGILSRGDIRCERIQPEAELVDQLVLREPPDLLLLDADLPEYDPFQTIRTLRRFQSFMLTPIFVCASPDGAEQARLAGATLFLRKPVPMKDMEEALARHVKPVLRKAPRKSLRGPCVVSKGGRKLEGRISDVSVLGAQVTMNDKIPLGTLVQLGFALMVQHSPHVIRVNARVVREVPGGYGLAFSALDQEARSLISAYAKT